jgi:hypothetical protein
VGYSTLIMEAQHTSETSVYYETTRRYIPEGSHLLNNEASRLRVDHTTYKQKVSFISENGQSEKKRVMSPGLFSLVTLLCLQ